MKGAILSWVLYKANEQKLRRSSLHTAFQGQMYIPSRWTEDASDALRESTWIEENIHRFIKILWLLLWDRVEWRILLGLSGFWTTLT